MRVLALCLLLSCSNRAPTCITACGITAFDLGACDGLAEAEAVTVEAYAEAVEAFDRRSSCQALSQWALSFHDDLKVPTGDGALIEADGYTDLGSMSFALRSTDWRTNAFAHEVGHILQFHLLREVDPTHSTWDTLGINRAIQVAHEEQR